ncbi:MAG: hypothetical protein E7258_06060 [Lachnospiraceae bacterium]|nr:hypothetical protein [Lachnospiraceae bacterium]
MKSLTQRDMYAGLQPMLMEGEVLTCPVTCMFLTKGVFVNAYDMTSGFASFTSYGRLFLSVYISGTTYGTYYDMRTVKKVTVKRNFAKQYIITFVFPGDTGDITYKIQIGTKLFFGDFVNQAQYANQFGDIARSYVR